MRWRGGTSQIVDLIHFDEEGKGHVVPNQFEHRVVHQVRDILLAARIEIVDTENFMTRVEQTIAEVGPQKAGTPGHRNPFASITARSG